MGWVVDRAFALAAIICLVAITIKNKWRNKMNNWDAIENSTNKIRVMAHMMPGGQSVAVGRIIDTMVHHMCWETLTDVISDEVATGYAESAIQEATKQGAI